MANSSYADYDSGNQNWSKYMIHSTNVEMNNSVAWLNYYAIDDTNISMKKVNVLHNMREYYEIGPGQKQYLGTGWGAYNAVTGYYSNVDNSEGIKRMDSLLFGDKSRKIETAGNLILTI